MSRGTPCVSMYRPTTYRIQRSHHRASLPLPCDLVQLSSAGFGIKQAFSSRGATRSSSLCSYQHRSLSIERAFCHGGFEEKYRTESPWMAWATHPSLNLSNQPQDPKRPCLGHTGILEAQGGETAWPRTHQLGEERREGRRYFPKAFSRKGFPGPLHGLSIALQQGPPKCSSSLKHQ